MDLEETIAAIATAPGAGLRSIIRVSGITVAADLASALDIPDEFFACRSSSVKPTPVFVPPLDRRVPIDIAFWPDHRSYTRQPMAEIHCIGSPPIVQSLLRTLTENGIRAARPGEFTLRAFLAGRIDLTQAAGVLGVIDAKNESEMQISLKQLAGGMSNGLRETQDELLNLVADVEAGLDFVDEDIEFISHENLLVGINSAISAIESNIQQLKLREIVQNEIRIVIFGQPNVGKSSLFNLLVNDSSNRENPDTERGNRLAANVDEVAGTTRDFNLANVTIKTNDQVPIRFQLIDTAGVQTVLPDGADTDSIESLAQQKTHEQIQDSDLKILCLDRSRKLDAWETGALGRVDPHRIIVLNKLDLPSATDFAAVAESPFELSCQSASGIEELRQELARRVGAVELDSGSSMTTAHCLASLRSSLEGLQSAREATQSAMGNEIVAGEMRSAIDNIGSVTGTIHTEDILDRIFSRFCIGK